MGRPDGKSRLLDVAGNVQSPFAVLLSFATAHFRSLNGHQEHVMKQGILCLLVVAVGLANPVLAREPGTFIGTVVAEWLDTDNRSMVLKAPFAYIDSSGDRWDAPVGSVVDGASIPRAAWTIIGGPYEGPYRNASVLHDVACVEKVRPSASVHRMFYEAMIDSGVSQLRAKVMYAAVYHGGPRWRDSFKSVSAGAPGTDSFRTATASDFADEALHGEDIQVRKRSATRCISKLLCIPAGEEFYAIYTSDNALTSEQISLLESKIQESDLSLEEIESLEITGQVN